MGRSRTCPTTPALGRAGEAVLPYELPKLPADLETALQEQAARDAAEAPVPVTVVLLGKEHTAFQQAMDAAKEELGKGARRGEYLERICLAYLDNAEERAGG